MNIIGSICITFFFSILLRTKVETYECNNSAWTNGSFFSFPNKIFESVRILLEEDPNYRTQLEIKVFPTENYFNSTCEVILSSDDENCLHYSKQIFDVRRSVDIPNLDVSEGDLMPGCNYSLVFVIDDHCIQAYYQIPEKRPCEPFPLEDTYNEFPNDILENVSISSFKKNAIRLNISLFTRPEYENLNGSIVISSKIPRCDHREEFRFSLAETSLVIPRAEFPHSFIDTGCDYMIDFELNNGKCVTTFYKVPDLCAGFHPKAEIIDVAREGNGLFRAVWDPKATEKKETDSIIDIMYRLEGVPFEEFNDQMIIENNYSSNYSMLNLSSLKRPGIYRLVATFINEKECSNVASFEFEVKGDPGVLLFIVATTLLIFGVGPAICMCIPSFRKKALFFSKRLFNETIIQVHAPNLGEPLYLDSIQKKEMINLSYVPIELEKCDHFEFPLNFRRLEFEDNNEKKTGNFGEVRKAKAFGINKTEGYTIVAVKQIRGYASVEEENALLEEINTLRNIAYHGNHENVVKMLACCSIVKPYMILLEYIPCGDLKSYLIELRSDWLSRKNKRHFIFPGDKSNGSSLSPNTRTISETSSNLPSPTETELTLLYDETEESLLPLSEQPSVLSDVDLQNFALQIARGMAFLESIAVVHRDLAARNVLISEEKILKISDFGMSRFGDYVHKNSNKQQPVRWMAPESIEKFTCTSKSDVWSFGVVLWEIGTLGAFPYDSISNDCILEYLVYNLNKGIRLMRPEICTDELYSLMLKCWSLSPEERPNFQQIVDFLSGEKKKIYLDLRKLNPAYVFPPTKQLQS